MRTKIALFASFDSERQLYLNENYLDAIISAGGLGTILPYTSSPELIQEFADIFDGFLFCGGVDIDPKYYGQAPIPETQNVCSERDAFEFAMFNAVYPTGKPILGICRGEQAINVFRGGTLRQHIDHHKQSDARNVRNQLTTLTPNGFLHKTLNCTEILTNSFHHQVVDRLGDGLVCEATSSDGYIEAVRDINHNFCIGVQWHPENYYHLDTTSSKLFKAFIAACDEYRDAQ